MAYEFKRQSYNLNNFFNPKIAFGLLFILFTFIFFRKILILTVFLVLEYICGEIKVWIKLDYPFDFAAMAIMYFSYYDFSFLINILLILNLIFTRFLYTEFTSRHIVKVAVLFFLGFFISWLTALDFITAVVISYMTRFFIEHIFLTMINGRIKFEYLPIQAYQIIFAVLFFKIFF